MSLLTSLISYWDLEEASGNALDTHGSNTLTDTNSVSSVAGKIGNARYFSAASNQYFTISDNTDLSTGDIDFSFALWLKFNTTSSLYVVFSKDNASTQREYAMYWDGSSRINFYVVSSGGSFGVATANTFGALSNGVWYFLYCYHDSVNNQVGISVNGGAIDTASFSLGVKDGTAPFQLGGGPVFGAGSSMDGALDSVGFWKKVLSSTEVADLYNSGSGLAYSSFGGATPAHFLSTLGVGG